MANFDEQMRLFEAEVGQGPPRPRPPFMPHSLRPRGGPPRGRGGHMPRGHVPPPPSFPPRAKNYGGGVKQYSSPAVISKPAENNDDDVFSTLLKYEKEVRQEKRDKKKEAKTQGQGPAKPPKEQRAQESMYKTATIAAPPVKPPSSNPMVPAALMKPSHISAQPTVTPVVKPGTQVTPDEIKLKAKQMVELVKASQVIQTKKLPQTPGTSKPSEVSGKMKKPKKMIRVAGGQVWEDASLQNWDHNDFRLFCGDLGNDVTDEVLTRTFSRYPSFQKARVIRDKRSNKSKGYGFVSFKDPADFTRAIKELNGKYVGSRPIKLSKSNWKDRNIDIVKSKQTVKKQMGYKY